MRAGGFIAVLLVAVTVGVAASWGTFRHAYVLHERAGVEWAALTLTDQAIAQTHQPQDADAAVYFSNAVIDKALKQLAGTTIGPVKSKLGDLVVTVQDAHLQPGLGVSGAVVDVKVASMQRNLAIDLRVEGDLSFRGIAAQSGDKATATAEFAVGVSKVEPRFSWGFLDIRGRNFLSEAISSGLMIALDRHLAVAVPFQDRIGFNTGFNNNTTIKAHDGTVSLNVSLPGKDIEQRFSFSAPVFLRSGIWLLAATSASGQAPVTPPTVPDLQPSELDSQVTTLRENIARATKSWDQESDFVLFLSGKALVEFVDKLKALPEANRTVTVRSTGATGHLEDNDTILVELPDSAKDINATMTIGEPSAEWTPEKGVALATDLRMNLHAHIKVEAKPVKMGTALQLEGSAGKHVSGTVELKNANVGGHSILSLGATMPCDTVTADVTTDGGLKVLGADVQLVKVGVRWTMSIPQTLGEQNLVMDDLPRRATLRSPKPDDRGITVSPQHKAIEYVVHVTDAKAIKNSYMVTAKLDMDSVDTAELPPEIIAQRQALTDSVKAAARTAAACPSVDPDMKVLFGGLEFGKNNEFVKIVTNAIHDILHGPGPSNDLRKAGETIAHDVVHGPGPNNDITGKNGWMRKRLGF
ncbi:hypothetical protein [Bradyrhizobium sp. WSM3983]|uniref:hypothetical protein n=1 Tax=Bradyrhizobium sp. WSM3983 TaxID=1038867 RepID=UPI0004823602|nr:hypothetical protein [Bradyrhizobium sp. WSM3983]